MVRCPVCSVGEIIDVEAEVYIDGDVKKIIVRGRCNRCGARVKIEKTYRIKIPSSIKLWRTADSIYA
jgi:hypothetical protein